MKEVRLRMHLEWQMKETYWIYMTWDYIWLSRKGHWIEEKKIQKIHWNTTCKWYGEEKNSQFSSIAQSWLTLCNSMDCSTPGFLVHCHLPELTQNHVHWVGDAIQSSHPLSSPTPSAFSLSQHQGFCPMSQFFAWGGRSPGVYSNSCPLSWWCHPTILSSVIPFSFCLQSFPASGSFPMSQLFTSGGQNIGASAAALSINIQV